MTRLETTGMSTPEGAPDVTVDIVTHGDQAAVDTVHIHAKDAIARALQAVAEEKHPDDCDGYVDIDWERRFEFIYGETGGDSE